MNVSIDSVSSDGAAWDSGKEDAFLLANDPSLGISLNSSSSSGKSSSSPVENITLNSEESRLLLDAIERQEATSSYLNDKEPDVTNSHGVCAVIEVSNSRETEAVESSDFFVEDSFVAAVGEDEKSVNFSCDIESIHSDHDSIAHDFELQHSIYNDGHIENDKYNFSIEDQPVIVDDVRKSADEEPQSTVYSIARQFEETLSITRKSSANKSENNGHKSILNARKEPERANHNLSEAVDSVHFLQRKALSVLNSNCFRDDGDCSTISSMTQSTYNGLDNKRKSVSGIAARIAAFEKSTTKKKSM